MTENSTLSSDLSEETPFDVSTIDVGKHEEEDITVKDENFEKAHKIGAGVAVGVVTSSVLGPVIGTIAGVAAANSTHRPGVAGDACRAAGDVALIARDKALEVNKKHGIIKPKNNQTAKDC